MSVDRYTKLVLTVIADVSGMAFGRGAIPHSASSMRKSLGRA
jgi:hypothetical protein